MYRWLGGILVLTTLVGFSFFNLQRVANLELEIVENQPEESPSFGSFSYLLSLPLKIPFLAKPTPPKEKLVPKVTSVPKRLFEVSPPPSPDDPSMVTQNRPRNETIVVIGTPHSVSRDDFSKISSGNGSTETSAPDISVPVVASRTPQVPISREVSPITQKVMVITYDPKMASSSGQRLHEDRRWNNPQDLERKFINDVREISGGYINYQVVIRQEVDGFSPVIDSRYIYDEASYLSSGCPTESPPCDNNSGYADYLKILNDFDVCGKRNLGEIDELWLWGGPGFGFFEAVMTGPNAFFTNGYPIFNSSCQRQLNIMGFQYQRGNMEMIHYLGHRVEGVMYQVYNEEPRFASGNTITPWGKFVTYNKITPGGAGCGWMHYTPNSQRDYEGNNQETVASTCEDWLNYPSLTGAVQYFNCGPWQCDYYEFEKWWFNHLPRYEGKTDGKWNNWWRYVLDYEGAKGS